MEQYLGITIGARKIKSVLMRREKKEFVVERIALLDLDAPAASPSGKKAVVESLRSIFKDIDGKHTRLIVALAHPDVHHLHLLLPKIPARELHEAVAWELKNQRLIPEAELIFDHRPVYEFDEGNVTKMKLAVSVSKRALVEETRALCLQAGLAPAAILPADAALEFFFGRLPLAESAVAILEMGEEATILFAYKNSKLEFIRKLPLTSVREIVHAVTATLVTTQGKVQLTAEEARETLGRYGMPEGPIEELVAGKISGNQWLSLLRPKIEQLNTELERSLDYFRESYQQNIQRIVLFESSAPIKGLARHLQHELDTPVEQGSIPHVSAAPGAVPTEDARRQLNAPIGACLTQGEWVNFLAEEETAQEKHLLKEMAFISLITVLVFGFVLSFLYLWNEKNMLTGRRADRQAQLQALLVRFDHIQEEQPLVEEVFRNPHWDQVFKELSNILPEAVLMTEISMKDNMIRLKGYIEHAPQMKSEELLADFMLTLEKRMFRNVHLVESRENERDGARTQFEILSAID